MKIKNIALVVLVIVVMILVPYSIVMRNAYYKSADENLILKDSLYKMEKEINNLKKAP